MYLGSLYCKQYGPRKGNSLVSNLTRAHNGFFMFLFCLVFAISLCASVFMCFVVTCWPTSWLSFEASAVILSLSHWYPGSGVVLDCIDS